MKYFELKEKQSKRLIRFAWALEIIFCITGIIIAFSLSVVGLQDANLSNTELIGIGMGFLPLFAIAIVELAKIPLVQGMLLAKSFVAKKWEKNIIFLKNKRFNISSTMIRNKLSD